MQTGNFSETEKVKHLLRRFGLGASEAEVEFYGKDGYKAAVDRLLASDQHEEPVVMGDEFLKNNDGQIIQNPRLAQQVWYAEQLITNRPLTYKMALFWHDHFATSAQKVSSGPGMLVHVHLLRDNGLGYFRDLLLKVSQDPAMLYWLDNQNNLVGKPNENFAREIMELFTLGEGNYSEKDIQEAAKAFTGWTYGIRRGNRLQLNRNQVPNGNSEFIFDEKSHDKADKAVFGNKGPWMGEDVIGILVGNPRSSQYLVQKIWEWFVYPKPEKAVIDKFSTIFRDSGSNMKPLLKAIMLSDEFQSTKAHRTIIKNPYDFCVPMMRQLGLGAGMVKQIAALSSEESDRGRRQAIAPSAVLKLATEQMGMELMYPPDVSGWQSGTQWITTSTMVERIQWGQELFTRNGNANQYPAFEVFGSDGDVEKLVDRVISVFDAEIPAAKRTQLVDAAKATAKGPLSRRNTNQVCGAVTKLLCSTPEFQFG